MRTFLQEKIRKRSSFPPSHLLPPFSPPPAQQLARQSLGPLNFIGRTAGQGGEEEREEGRAPERREEAAENAISIIRGKEDGGGTGG